ncbi:unnamed protein product [Darwinula stevensoni]|uniref:DUF7044 domain-containing protein n=1 Tax=Darwinula stevensoni TaxID=69355 RepID=A0A7R9A8T9_9CRUS|nr:unnamed protein product [Darwinula stevensoni]CAG0896563.1 unnamed protein product [Darwinula stevensoni]
MEIVFVLEACPVPYVIRGAWYSREWGRDTVTEFDAISMSDRGECHDMLKTHNDNFTFVFLDSSSCYHCVQILVRTVNIIEKREKSVQMWKFEFEDAGMYQYGQTPVGPGLHDHTSMVILLNGVCETDIFQSLVSTLARHFPRGNTSNVPFQNKVLLLVWTLANRDSFRELGDRFNMSRGGAHNIYEQEEEDEEEEDEDDYDKHHDPHSDSDPGDASDKLPVIRLLYARGKQKRQSIMQKPQNDKPQKGCVNPPDDEEVVVALPTLFTGTGAGQSPVLFTGTRYSPILLTKTRRSSMLFTATSPPKHINLYQP